MTIFSEAIKKEIKKSKQTLLYLSDISGLSVDHISKMRLGKRLPQDEEKVKRLIDALQCTEETSRELFSMYKIERMGGEEWGCMQEICRMLSFRKPAVKMGKDSRPGLVSGIAARAERNTHVLGTRTEVFQFLHRELLSGDCLNQGKLRMITEGIPDVLMEMLTIRLNYPQSVCEHIFSLKKSRETEGCLYNIRYVNQIMPLIQSSGMYEPYYDYEEHGNELFPNWMINSRWAVGLDRDMETGIVIWDQEQLDYLQKMFEQRKQKKRSLLIRYNDAVQWMDQVSDGREEYLKNAKQETDSIEGKKNYYIEYTPCVAHMLPKEMIEKHLLIDESSRDGLFRAFERRGRQLECENMVHFFSLEGLERMISQGRISGVPDYIYRPLEPKERLFALRLYIRWMREHNVDYYITDSQRLPLAPYTALYSTVSLTNNEVSICMAIGESMYCSIHEQGIAEKIHNFCKLMEKGEFVYEREKTDQIMERVIQNVEKEVKS